MTNQQMELAIENGRLERPQPLPAKRPTRAQWWFRQMREVVDKAFDWQPAPPARPQQIWFRH